MDRDGEDYWLRSGPRLIRMTGNRNTGNNSNIFKEIRFTLYLKSWTIIFKGGSSRQLSVRRQSRRVASEDHTQSSQPSGSSRQVQDCRSSVHQSSSRIASENDVQPGQLTQHNAFLNEIVQKAG